MSAEYLLSSESDRLIGYLLDRMTPPTRNALMAEMPVIYAKLFPTVTAELIASKVRDQINETRGNA